MATFTNVSSNYSKNYYQVIVAFLVLLIYCASNNTSSSDYEIFNFEKNSKSAMPPPKSHQTNYQIRPGKYLLVFINDKYGNQFFIFMYLEFSFDQDTYILYA